MNKNGVLVTFYGDDLTGSTATAEALTESGTPTLMFPKAPTAQFLKEHFPKARAIGIAGISRTIAADKLEDFLTPTFQILKEYESPIYLYKICSTFDSSEHKGSIGKAIELGMKIFSAEFVPVLCAAPRIGRYTVFGHHFAALGHGEIFRLDRHPSMSNHPVTPMDESDLRRHLARQTGLKSGLVNILQIDAGPEHIKRQIDKLISEKVPLIFFDTIYNKHIKTICNSVFKHARLHKPLLFVGSQELGYGFSDALINAGLLKAPALNNESEKKYKDKGPILAISGSCATVTGSQILNAGEAGFINVAVQPQNLINPEKRKDEREKLIKNALEALDTGKSILLHTAVGPEDDRIKTMRAEVEKLSLNPSAANDCLGDQLGEICRSVIDNCSVKRIVIAGGDTAGRIQHKLGIEVLQVSKPVGTVAAPLCYVYSKLPDINGLEMAFKGGQIGSVDYFHQAQIAHTPDFEDIALGKL